MKTFKPSTIMAALISSGVAFSAAPLYAQESPDTSIDEVERPQEDTLERIEVRGFSTSLIQSLNQKRFSDTVSEQISADDLGGLPDVSMADALTRLPGISAVLPVKYLATRFATWTYIPTFTKVSDQLYLNCTSVTTDSSWRGPSALTISLRCISI